MSTFIERIISEIKSNNNTYNLSGINIRLQGDYFFLSYTGSNRIARCTEDDLRLKLEEYVTLQANRLEKEIDKMVDKEMELRQIVKSLRDNT